MMEGSSSLESSISPPSLIADTEMVFLDEYSSIVLATVPGMKKRTLVPNTTYFELSVFSYGISHDKKFVYLAHDYFKVRSLIIAQQKMK
jgi:hypothetical protein